MTALYNENDRFPARWLRNLVDAGHIAHGKIDRRSIKRLIAEDLEGITQAHFFAGIGGWSRALRLAGWPDDAPVWTGSCPCQPFSQAGSGAGLVDPRHLWPDWYRLICQCLPAVIFGEQVASKVGLKWFDLVRADLERAGYAVGVADLCAASVGAPHIRQRLFFGAYRLADYYSARRSFVGKARLHAHRSRGDHADRCGSNGLADATGVEQSRRLGESGARRHAQRSSEPQRLCEAGGVGDAGRDGDRQHDRELSRDEAQHEVGPTHGDHAPVDSSAARNSWDPCAWVQCRDGKQRPVEPGTFPLADGVPDRVGQLRGYGNAIVPAVAAAFIESFMEALP